MAQEWLEGGLARIHDRNRRRAIGGGLLIGSRHVVTCAHVVASALGRKGLQYAESDHRGRLWVSFPTAVGNRQIKARVARGGWRRIDPRSLQGDIAVLELAKPAPAGCDVPPLLCPPDLRGHEFIAKGFPPDARRTHPGGAAAKGSISVAAGPGGEWHLLVDDRATLIRPGFSGTPVWDETAEAVVGIVVARDHRWVKTRAQPSQGAFMIPLSVLIDTWEPLGRAVGWRVRFDPERDLHWRPRSRGVQRVDDKQQLFSGRKQALEELVEWLREPEGTRMVTGRPGSGKSAVLARLVMLADPDENAALMQEAAATTVPTEHAIDLAIVADGSLCQKRAIETIARWTGAKANSPRALLRTLAERERPPVIVVDQLDEARDPMAIAELLRRLAQKGAARVLVGLRKDDEQWLQRRLEPAAATIDLDEAPYFDSSDLRAYARRLLLGGRAHERGPAAAEDVAETIAAEIAERADRSFLIAWLLATPLAEAQVLSPLPTKDYPEEFELGHAMERYVAAAAEQAATEEEDLKEIEGKMRDLLTAVAFAEGPGLPVAGEVWPAVATAVSDRSDPEYTAKDIDDLRQTPARHLLQFDDSGHARLFHRELAAELRRRRGDEAEAQRRVAQALARLCPSEPASAPPYVEAHLAGHVRKASDGAWEELAGASRVLDRLDPLAVSSEARRSGVRLGRLPEAIRGVVNSQRLMAHGGPGDRAGLRQLGMARVCGRSRFAAGDAMEEISDWRIRSAVLRRYPPHFTTAAGAPVRALVSFSGRDGEPMLAAGCADGSVRLWGALTGQPSGDPPSGDSPVQALSACEVAGVSWLVSGDKDGTVRMWSALDLEVTDFPSGHRQLRAVAAFACDGELLVATAGEKHETRVWRNGQLVGVLPDEAPLRALTAIPRGDGATVMAGGEGDNIRVWDIDPGVLSAADPPHLQPRHLLSGFSSWVRALCAFGEGNELRVAAVGEDLRLHVWQPPTVDQIAESAALHSASVRAIAAYGTDAGFRVATAGRDGEIRFWNPDNGRPLGSPSLGHDGTVAALAAYEAGGTAGLVSAGDDGSARFWGPAADGDAEISVASALPTTAVAAADIAGGTCAVTGDEAGWVRIWDPETGEPVYDAFRAHAKPVRVIAPYCDGNRLLVASGDDDGIVHFHDSETGEKVAAPLVGHGEPVRALLLGVEVDRELVITTAGEDGTVRFWRQDSHEEIPELGSRHGENGPVRDLAPLQLGKHGDCLAVVGFSRELLVRRVAKPEVVVGPVEAHVDWVMAVEAYRGLGGARLATAGDDGAIRTYNPHATTPPQLLGRHEDPVRGLAVLPDGERHLIASGGADGVIRIWDPEARQVLRVIHLGTAVNAICALGRDLLAGTAEGHLVLSVRFASR